MHRAPACCTPTSLPVGVHPAAPRRQVPSAGSTVPHPLRSPRLSPGIHRRTFGGLAGGVILLLAGSWRVGRLGGPADLHCCLRSGPVGRVCGCQAARRSARCSDRRRGPTQLPLPPPRRWAFMTRKGELPSMVAPTEPTRRLQARPLLPPHRRTSRGSPAVAATERGAKAAVAELRVQALTTLGRARTGGLGPVPAAVSCDLHVPPRTPRRQHGIRDGSGACTPGHELRRVRCGIDPSNPPAWPGTGAAQLPARGGTMSL